MTGLEKLFIYWWGGIIWDLGGNFSKFIDPGSHRGAFHRDTWTGCVIVREQIQGSAVLTTSGL